MTENPVQFKVNSPDVVSETIDGEAVIVSLARGTYYSLNQVGAEVWNLIESGHTFDTILNVIEQRFDGDLSEITNSVKELIAQLQAEQLITQVEASPVTADPESTTNVVSSPQKFVPPVLEKYSDMQDLLMLDPIHEVDETEGWPAKKEETTV